VTLNYETNQVKLIALVKDRYLQSLNDLEHRFSRLLDELIAFIAKIDVAISNAKCAKAMQLTRPILVDEAQGYEAIGLRHPIIEANQQTGIYIPNDIYLGEGIPTKQHITLNATEGAAVHGVLLYGINLQGNLR